MSKYSDFIRGHCAEGEELTSALLLRMSNAASLSHRGRADLQGYPAALHRGVSMNLDQLQSTIMLRS
jgi:hypothetical protein